MNSMMTPDQSELGKKSEYDPQYNPNKLFAIPRKVKREEIGVPEPLPFVGYDLWNHYEVSWLNPKGKPMVALAEIMYGCETPCIIESKSMKLYFNSFNNTRIESPVVLKTMIEKDISQRVLGPATVNIFLLDECKEKKLYAGMEGECIDHLDIECFDFDIHASVLKVEEVEVEETLYSNLLKSNCLVTHQPDWGTVQISYQGSKINQESLLQYIVSFRNHNEFHEQCIERIYMDILRQCKPKSLMVYGRYTRRGGLDINPLRTNNPNFNIKNLRLCRQ